SALPAAARASSAATVMKALSVGSSPSSRASTASTTSTGESSLRAIRSASRDAGRKQRSSSVMACSLVAAVDSHDHLAGRASFGERPDRVRRMLKGKGRRYQRPELARQVPLDELVHGFPQLVGSMEPEEAQRRAEGGAVLHEQAVGGDLGDAADEADQQDAPAPAERGEGLIE